jgi:hypothetical protein
MLESDFWRELAIAFGNPVSRYDFEVFRHYSKGRYEARPNWQLTGTDAAIAEFNALAHRAATKIANPWRIDLSEVWLEAVWQDSITGTYREVIEVVEKNEITGSMRLRGKIDKVFRASSTLCRRLEAKSLKNEFLQRQVDENVDAVLSHALGTHEPVNSGPSTPSILRDRYLANFPEERIIIRDVCWAAGQHYREWKRWLAGEFKDGSTPDLAFRRLLTSGKRPLEFNKKPRPNGWE